MLGPRCSACASLVTRNMASRELERSAAATKRAAGPANALLERLGTAAEATDAQAAQAREAAAAARQQLQEAVAAQRCLLSPHASLPVKHRLSVARLFDIFTNITGIS